MGEITTEAAPLAEGEVVAGKYRIDRVLGRGGMGWVMAATHVQLQQCVALKFLRADMLGNSQVIARFMREAQAAARIQGLHVARVLDVGELLSGAPFMVMEYLDGEDLEQTLRRRGALPVSEAVDLLLQGAEAVAEAHTLGIVHRDLKPANLFLAHYPGGRQIVKVLDFGISKVQEPEGSPVLTQPSSMFGSPPYMAPEQVRSARAADARSDIWSLGAVLYELLTQAVPFPSDSYQTQFAAILLNEPTPPRALRQDIPPGLEAVILRCLQKDPGRRFQNVASLASALAPFGSPNSADVSARIGRVISTAVTGVAPSATAMAEGAEPVPLPGATRLLDGAATVPSAPTSPVEGVALREATLPFLAERAPVTAHSSPSFQGEVVSTGALAQAGSGRRARMAVIGLIATLLVGALAIAAMAAARSLAPRPSRGPVAANGVRAITGSPRAPATPLVSSAPTMPAATAVPVATGPAPASAPSSPPALPRQRDASRRPHERASAAVEFGVALPSVCADLLARQSLGETLTSEELSTYARACRRQ